VNVRVKVRNELKVYFETDTNPAVDATHLHLEQDELPPPLPFRSFPLADVEHCWIDPDGEGRWIEWIRDGEISLL
jgi:hypothetical protein